MRVILAALLFLFFSSPLFAASVNSPAYRHVEFEANYPWNEGLSIRFPPDEALCKSKYGKQWQIKCAASIGRYGQVVKGVKLEPEAAGHWEWRGDQITFIPKNAGSLSPDTLYKVDLSGIYLPATVRLDTFRTSCRTPRLAARLLDSRFLVDPSSAGVHRMVASFEFNFPVRDKDWLPELDLPEKARAGKAEATWNNQRDRLTVSWPIIRLPEKASQARIKMGRMEQTVMQDGLARFHATGGAGLFFVQNLPARDAIFNIAGIELRQERDADLNRRYVLVLRTSLQTRPSDILASMLVLELPEFLTRESVVPYDWSNAPSIPADVKKRSRELKPRPLKNDGAAGTVFEYELPVTSDRHIMVAVDPGLSSLGGLKLNAPWFGTAHADAVLSGVGFMHSGHILPGNGELALFGNDLDSIRWEVRVVDQSFMGILGLASSQPFSKPLEKLAGTGIGFESLGEAVTGEIPLSRKNPGEAQFAALKLDDVLRKLTGTDSGLAMVTLKGVADGREKAVATRLILATDLALIVKEGATGSLECFVRLMSAKKPANGAIISILGANGKPVAQGRADNEGYVAFPSLKGLSRDMKPVAALAEHGGNLAWMPLRDKSRELNYSEFAVGGRHVSEQDIIVYLFNQRDIYRPGDSLHFGCIFKKGDFTPVPANIPFYAELLNPRGQKIWEDIVRTSPDGIVEVRCDSESNTMTGKYTLNVRVGRKGRVLATSAARIEEFEPDLMRMKLSPPSAKGWVVAGTPAVAHVGLQNLYGVPAANHRVTGKYVVSPALFQFPAYQDYVFADPAPFIGAGVDGSLGDAQTDRDGQVSFTLPSALGAETSALVTLVAGGYEKSGGRACGDASSFIISPVSMLLGWKPLGALTNPSFVPLNSKASANLIAINNQLEKSGFKNLVFSLARGGRVANLVSDGNGGYRLDEIPQETIIRTWRADVAPGGLDVVLDTGEPGEYAFYAADESGRIYARLPYTVVSDQLAAPDGGQAPSKMRMRLEKMEYRSGDSINIAFSLPYDASGIITIEREGVVAHNWVDAHAGDNLASIDIPPGFEGRGHVVATFMRSPSSGPVFMSPMAWAVSPFTVNMKVRDMGLKLEAPSLALPGRELEVGLRADKPGSVIVFAVDEGILQLSRYAVPNPLQALLGDRALDVRTLQTADLLLPLGMKPHGRRDSVFGGGADLGSFGKQFMNPFKRRAEPPVVFWSGIFAVGDAPTSVRIPVPAWYDGTLRIMAVGSGSGSAGAVSCEAIVRSPLILTPILPVALAPGDHFQGSLVIANTTSVQINVEPRLSASACLRMNNNWPEYVRLEPGEEKVLLFDAEAGDTPGECSVVFEAAAGKESRVRYGSISIRPASPLRTTLQAGVISASGELPIDREVYPQFAKSVVTLSGLPVSFARGLARYLDTYPHGCTEQLLSRSLALVALWDASLPGEEMDRRKSVLDSTIMALRTRFNGDGVALWPHGNGDLLLTAYAVDYLLFLRESGLGAHDDLLKSLCDSLAWNCALNEPTLAAARASAYALWVLAREGRIVTQLLETLIDNLEEKGVSGWKNDLSGLFIAAAMREMRMPTHFDFAAFEINPSGWFDEYAHLAFAVLIRARYFPESLRSGADDLIHASMRTMNKGVFSTFSAAQGIRALLALGQNAAPVLAAVSLDCMDDGVSGDYGLSEGGKILSWTTSLCSRYGVGLPNDVERLYWQISTTGFDRELSDKAASNGITVTREYLDESGKPVSEIMHGDEVTVRVSVTSELHDLSDMVIVDLLPGGLEMIMPAREPELPAGVKWLERREDRMLIFADLKDGQLEMKWKARAVTPGSFAAPVASAQSMYQPGINGSTSAGCFNVKPGSGR